MPKDKEMEEEVRASVGSIYGQLLNKRKADKEYKEEQKRLEREAREEEEKEKYTKDSGEIMSKKERREKDLEAWKDVVQGLTGDDLEYRKPKQKKKKYRKWIDDDDTNSVVDKKPKKIKKRNYEKQFQPELNLLKNLVSEQNKFTADLQKRFVNAAGPATKDAMMPNKTLVDLASAINNGRANSLGLLREIAGTKKTIAELTMKQRKLDADMAGSSNFDSTDMGLMGSNIASALFGNTPTMTSAEPTPTPPPQPVQPQSPIQASPIQVQQASPVYEAYDPDSWVGPELENDFTRFENIPTQVIVERDRNTGCMRFAAINTETDEELEGYNLPTVDPNKLQYNEKDGTIKGEFDESFPVRLVG